VLFLLVAGSLPAYCADEQRPFPQHTVYTHGTLKPSAKSQAVLDEAVLHFFKEWKQRYLCPSATGQLYVAANREGKLESPATRSISEGHGYGMLAAALMAGPGISGAAGDPDAHAIFDALYRFFRAHPTATHRDLMGWRQVVKPHSDTLADPAPEDCDSATDGDLDIAYALLLAHQQWGSQGAVDYKAEAVRVIEAIRDGETDAVRNTLTLGDWVDGENSHRGGFRPSDFMPGHLKAFAAASGDPCWKKITDSTYRVLAELVAEVSPKTGLLPDFVVLKHSKYAPAPGKFLEGLDDGHYSYNACRCPWRIGTDYLTTGDPRALALLQPLNAWIRRTTHDDPSEINAGYTLDGRRLDRDSSAAFVGPLAVAAMADPDGQQWLDALWKNLLGRNMADEGYYGNSVKLMTLIVLSGNWW
jgi:endo-1,4-beta-D-glucanase Y